MNIKLSLALPRDESTLPLVRHLCKYSLWEIGVSHDCVHDVELALTEACANVVEHARGDDAYEVHIEITENDCEIRVVDTGHGFDVAAPAAPDHDVPSEGGRGLHLIRALVDRVNFVSEPKQGTVVHLTKSLAFHDPPAPFLEREQS